MRAHRIALIPGDGVGTEVLDTAWTVLKAAASRQHFTLEGELFPWSCRYFEQHGRMMPEDGLSQLSQFDAIFLGAVGWPQTVPDSVSLHGLLLPIRKKFDLFVNERPHRLLPGTQSPLRKDKFDILCIRENTEGEYAGAGGRVHVGTSSEVAVETSVFTRRAITNILRYGFERARQRSGRLASVTKSNAQRHSMVLWDEITEEVAAEFPDVRATRYHVDAIAARFVTHPESLDVVVASNLFGDILSDLGAAIQGGLGFAASANLNPSSDVPSMFEPVHGSAPDIAGQGIANPLAAIWAGSMMLSHLGETAAADSILRAIESVTAERRLLTPDQGGSSSTAEVGSAVVDALR